MWQVEKETYTVDHEVHDRLGHEVCDGLVNDVDVGAHEVADDLHLPLQLRVHGHGVPVVHRIFAVGLEKTRDADPLKAWNMYISEC